MSIFLLHDRVATIDPNDLGLRSQLEEIQPDSTTLHAGIRFIMAMLSLSASEFLRCLQILNDSIEEIEKRLQRSLRNEGVLQLLNIQKSLVYFAMALRSIESLIDKLRRTENLQWSTQDVQIAEDSLVEIRQAVYQVEIAENILMQMMNAFASIVSNNLNSVMKFLAAITIVISLPMLIASLYGMNVALPGSSQPGIFAGILAGSFVLSVAVILLFRKLDWL